MSTALLWITLVAFLALAFFSFKDIGKLDVLERMGTRKDPKEFRNLTVEEKRMLWKKAFGFLVGIIGAAASALHLFS